MMRRMFAALGLALILTGMPQPAVALDALGFTSGPPASPVTAGTAVSHTFTAAGGTEPYNFSLVSGGLPVGMSMSSAGVFSGTPVSVGGYTFTVRVTDGAAVTADQIVSLSVVAPVITFPSGPPASPVTAGTAVSHTFTATGGTAPYNFSLVSGGLPVGMSMSSAGVFSGTPVSVGSYTFTVRATDAHGFSGDLAVTLAVVAPTITLPPPAPPAQLFTGQPFTHTFTSAGGAAPYQYSLVSGGLPIGVSLSSAGVLSGTPGMDGTFTFTVRSTDVNGFTGDKAVTIVVADPAVAFTSAAPPSGVAGTPYSFTFTAEGDSNILFSVSSGALPAGLALSSAGVLSGTPAAEGTVTFTVKATGTGSSATQDVTLTIAAATQLPRTGTSLPLLLGTALVAVAGGGALFYLARRRRFQDA